MNRSILILALSVALVCSSRAGTRILTFIHQPLTTLGTDQDAAVIVARIPVLTNAVPESIIAHIASPNKLIQDSTAEIADSNLLSLLDIKISAKPVTERIYDVTLDIREMRPSDRFGVTAGEVVAATIECLKKMFGEQRWDTFVLRIQSRDTDKTDWKPYEGRVDAK
jgi:hypothetical protein